MNVLLTGFEPWGRNRRNPSGEVARALGGFVLPVSYNRAEKEILRLIRTIRPEAILLLGFAPGRSRIALEAVAMNVDHSEEEKERRWRRRIRKGPFILSARLPLDSLYRRLKRARIPVSISHHAGTFICNHVFYIALANSTAPCGFVHLPPTRLLPMRIQLRAVQLILDGLR